MNRWEHCLTYTVLILKKFGVFIVYGQPEVDEPYTTMASMEIPLFVVFTRQPLQRQRSVGRLRSPTAARRLKEGFMRVVCGITVVRVLARILKMPVQNSNFKISARPDLATDLLQIIIPTTFNSLVCQKEQFILQLCPRRWYVRKICVYCPPKVKNEKFS